MAKKTNEEAEALEKTGTERAASDPVYTVEEFAAASHEVFQAGPDIVIAAFRYAGITCATRKEAKKIVEIFRERPVSS